MAAAPVIIALDSHPLDFDGLSWEAVAELGRFQHYPRSSRSEALDRAGEAEIVLVNKFVLDRHNLPELRKLRCICVTATGTNNVDLDYCRQHGITVSNVKDYSTPAVAQLVFAYLLHLANKVADYNRLVQEGRWHSAPDFCLGLPGQWELAGKTIGIVGYGAIGQAVAAVARAFSMKVLAGRVPGRSYPDGQKDSSGTVVERVELETLFSTADIVTLHPPLTDQTKDLINSRTLQLMKPGAILINTGRGGLVCESDLAQALNQGKIAYACLDVVSTEPPAEDNPLFSAPHTIFTPHIAWSSREARQRLMGELAENIRAFLRGEPRNRVA